MRNWSIEELFVKAYGAAAVAVQGVLDAFGTIERITRPPLTDADGPNPCDTGDCWYDAHGHACPRHCFDGAEQLAEREAEEEVHESVDDWLATRIEGGYLISPAVSGDPAGVSPSGVDPFPRDPSEGRPNLADCGVAIGRSEMVECDKCDDWPFAVQFPDGSTRYICEDHGVISTTPASPRSTWADLAERMSNHLPSAKVEHPDDAAAEWIGEAVPVINAVLQEHARRFDCNHPDWGNCRCGFKVEDSSDWREHVAPRIANALAPHPKTQK
jgi:hypothetical protein